MLVTHLLGVFYTSESGVMVADELSGTRDVDAALREFEGKNVQLLAHHRPAEPLAAERWGGGCCYWQGAGECPFGHHTTTDALYLFSERGVLRRQEGWDSLDEDEVHRRLGGLAGRSEGAVVSILARQVWWEIVDGDHVHRVRVDLLVGHRGELVVVHLPEQPADDPTRLSLEQIEESVGALYGLLTGFADGDRGHG